MKPILSPQLYKAIQYVYKNKGLINAPFYLGDICTAYMILDAGGTEDSAISALLYANMDYFSGDDISLLFGENVVNIMTNLMTFEEELSLVTTTESEVSLIACAIYLQELRESSFSLDWDVEKSSFYEEMLNILEDLSVPSVWIDEMIFIKEFLDKEVKCCYV